MLNTFNQFGFRSSQFASHFSIIGTHFHQACMHLVFVGIRKVDFRSCVDFVDQILVCGLPWHSAIPFEETDIFKVVKE